MRKYLVDLRKDKNLTQQKVADDLNVSRAFYSMIESGKRNPTLKLARDISEYFKTDLEEIFFKKECHETEQKINQLRKEGEDWSG